MKKNENISAFSLFLLAFVLVTNSLSAQGTWTTKNKKNTNLTHNMVTALFKDSKGAIWAGTSKGLNKFDNDICTNYLDANGLKLKKVTGISEDSQHNIWISLRKCGVVKYDGSTWTLYDSKNGLCNSKGNCVYTDSKGNVWVGTRNGVSKFDGKTWTTYTVKTGLAQKYVLAIFEDKKGNIWFGTLKGVSKFDGKDWVKYTQKDGLARQSVLSINEDSDGKMWFGTYTGKFSTFDGVKWESMKKGSGYYHWGTLLGGVSSGILWGYIFGAPYGILYTGLYAGYAAFPQISDATQIHVDAKKNLWLSAIPKGVFKYDGSKWVHLMKKDGLAHNWVYSIAEDNKGNMWFGTPQGISILSK
ncbi:MAG: hypothetical protein NT004_10985 [Bacteroidetes bacterium]|nr:hypothetical protein [Bacteroidota bacterium]